MGPSKRPKFYDDAAAVVPHDSNPNEFNAFYVGVVGDVTVRTIAGTTVTFTAVPAGEVVPVAVDQIHSTGTSATNIVGMRTTVG